MNIEVIKVEESLDQELITHLENHGFNNLIQKSNTLSAGEHWRIHKRIDSKFECICNDKTPQVHITYYHGAIVKDGKLMHQSTNYEVELYAEADMTDVTKSWVKVKLNVDRKDLLGDNLDTLVNRIVNAWEALNG